MLVVVPLAFFPARAWMEEQARSVKERTRAENLLDQTHAARIGDGFHEYSPTLAARRMILGMMTRIVQVPHYVNAVGAFGLFRFVDALANFAQTI